MLPVQSLFESHLNVGSLARSMDFYGGVLKLELAHFAAERGVAFYWIGKPGTSMLGLWEVGTTPQKTSLHIAFSVDLSDVLDAPRRLQEANITSLDFWDCPSQEPTVLAWMPAASVYFRDPDGNLLEFLAMLPDAPQPELGVIDWKSWTGRKLNQ